MLKVTTIGIDIPVVAGNDEGKTNVTFPFKARTAEQTRAPTVSANIRCGLAIGPL
jgi:hypothetical protein